MSLSAKREALARIHGRYGRAGRPHKTRILEEFCATCGYHRKAALRLLNRPLRTAPPKRSGPKLTYDPLEVLPVLKALWLASDQLCSKLLKAALPQWLEHHERRTTSLPEALRKLLLKISPAQIDRLLRPARVQHPKKGISATRPGTLLRHEVPTRGGPPDTTRPGSVEADTVAHCDDSTVGIRTRMPRRAHALAMRSGQPYPATFQFTHTHHSRTGLPGNRTPISWLQARRLSVGRAAQTKG